MRPTSAWSRDLHALTKHDGTRATNRLAAMRALLKRFEKQDPNRASNVALARSAKKMKQEMGGGRAGAASGTERLWLRAQARAIVTFSGMLRPPLRADVSQAVMEMEVAFLS